MKNYTEQLIDIFQDINTIPRKSGNRGPITDYFKSWAETQGLAYREDHVQNLIIEVPGTKGYENSPLVVLQGHTDMVCEKTPQSDHDFSKDPIVHVREGDWLRADGTSLGADNGVALAMAMLCASDPSIAHPPLELLFTTDEEIGLWGADEIKPGFVKGKILLNLDSEQLGIFTIGCAGAVISHMDFSLAKEDVPGGFESLTLRIGGFRGGHSGGDIHKQRGNATAELIRGLDSLFKEIPFQIGEIKGGSAMNAISRSAEATIAAPADKLDDIKRWWEKFGSVIVSENKTAEDNAFVETLSVENPSGVFSAEDTGDLLVRLRLIPHGVVHMNADLPDQLETSLNFGVVETGEKGVRITTMQRGSVKSRLREITDRVETLASLFGAEFTLETFMDPWQPDWNSPLVDKSVALWKKLYNENAELVVTHGGLECGIIGSISGGMDMISFGPDIEDPHSPDERLKISSLGKSFEFLRELLASLK